jgi:hypothetical protein
MLGQSHSYYYYFLQKKKMQPNGVLKMLMPYIISQTAAKFAECNLFKFLAVVGMLGSGGAAAL